MTTTQEALPPYTTPSYKGRKLFYGLALGAGFSLIFAVDNYLESHSLVNHLYIAQQENRCSLLAENRVQLEDQLDSLQTVQANTPAYELTLQKLRTLRNTIITTEYDSAQAQESFTLEADHSSKLHAEFYTKIDLLMAVAASAAATKRYFTMIGSERKYRRQKRPK